MENNAPLISTDRDSKTAPMFSRNRLIIGILFLFAVVGIGAWYWQSRESTETNFQQQKVFLEKDLIGTWLFMVDGVPEHGGEEMDFSIESGVHTFNSYLHNRLEYSNCAWNLQGNIVHIACQNSENNIDLKILSLNISLLNIESDVYSGTFQKLKRVTNKATPVSLLDTIDKNLESCTDTDPTTAGVTQCISVASEAYTKEIERLLKTLHDTLPADQTQLLVQSQNEWLIYKEKEATLIRGMYSLKQGTMFINMYEQSLLNVVRARAQALDKYLNVLLI